MDLRLKRVYEPADASDGYRILVDRLWPRGVSKERAAIDLWEKATAPSPELRKAWHAAPPDEWENYAVQYRHALETDLAPALAELRAVIAEHDVVTFVYAAHDPVHNHARVLAEVVQE